jgi:hypothetical protein
MVDSQIPARSVFNREAKICPRSEVNILPPLWTHGNGDGHISRETNNGNSCSVTITEDRVVARNFKQNIE